MSRKHRGLQPTPKRTFPEGNKKQKTIAADKIVTEYVFGASISGLSRKYNVSRNTVRRYLQRADIKIRPSFNHLRKQKSSQNFQVSRLEDVVAEELDRRGIQYMRQLGIKDPITGKFFACVDFILENGTVLEVNGTFWHSDPRVYKDGPQYESQKRALERYRKKLKVLERLQIPVIEVWEIDVVENVERAVGTALKSLRRK